MFWFLITFFISSNFPHTFYSQGQRNQVDKEVGYHSPLVAIQVNKPTYFFLASYLIFFRPFVSNRPCLTKLSCAGGPRHQGPAGAHGVPRLLPRRQARQEGQAWSRSVRSSSPVRREALPNYKSNFWQVLEKKVATSTSFALIMFKVHSLRSGEATSSIKSRLRYCW